MKRSMKRSRKSKSKGKCKTYLSKKIGINMAEYRQGMYVSPAQAIAVAYSQVRKSHPTCKRVLKSKKSKRRSKRRRDGRSRRYRQSQNKKSKLRKIKPSTAIHIRRNPSILITPFTVTRTISSVTSF